VVKVKLVRREGGALHVRIKGFAKKKRRKIEKFLTSLCQKV
jgi:hypothetical protein